MPNFTVTVATTYDVQIEARDQESAGQKAIHELKDTHPFEWQRLTATIVTVVDGLCACPGGARLSYKGVRGAMGYCAQCGRRIRLSPR